MSQGGFLSMRAALLAPGRVRALVLIDTQSGPEDPDRLPAYRQMQETWSRSVRSTSSPRPSRPHHRGPVLSETWIAKWHKLPREAMKAPCDCLFEREDLTDRVTEITCPAIVFHGTADMSIEVDKAQALSERLPGSTGLVLIEGGPHASNLTHPEQVNAPLLAFLRSL